MEPYVDLFERLKLQSSCSDMSDIFYWLGFPYSSIYCGYSWYCFSVDLSQGGVT